MSAKQAEEALRCIRDIERRGWEAHLQRCRECREDEAAEAAKPKQGTLL